MCVSRTVSEICLYITAFFFLTFIIFYLLGLCIILCLFLLCIVWLRLSTIMIKRKWWWWSNNGATAMWVSGRSRSLKCRHLITFDSLGLSVCHCNYSSICSVATRWLAASNAGGAGKYLMTAGVRSTTATVDRAFTAQTATHQWILFMTTCGMDDHDKKKRTEFNCTQR